MAWTETRRVVGGNRRMFIGNFDTGDTAADIYVNFRNTKGAVVSSIDAANNTVTLNLNSTTTADGTTDAVVHLAAGADANYNVVITGK